ncbi:Eukaryotic/viral aspartic protease, partial [Phytophthora megakarya]
MRAPESDGELTFKTVSKDAGRQYTAEAFEYALSRMELFRQLERNPVVSFIKPKLISELTGPFHELDFSKLTSVCLAIQALFAVLRESGFVLGAFEMERVYDWDHESWTNPIHAILDPLTVLVGTVKHKTTMTPFRKARRESRCLHRLAATPAEPETPSTEGRIPKALEDAIVRLMQSTRMQTAPGTTPPAPRYTSPTPASRRATTDTVPQESTDVAMESVSSRSSSHSKQDQDEDPDDLFDLDAGLTGTAAAVSITTAGAEFNGKDASEEKARAWFNRLKCASRRDGMTGDEVCALFGGWPDPRVSGMRAKIRYSDGTPEEKREHVELFINTLGAQEQELASRLTLTEVPDTATLEKKLRARQRGLAHQKKTLFGSNRFRQKASTPTPTLARAVHAVQIAADDYDSGREGDSDDGQKCDQDRDDEERANMFVTGHASQQENVRRDFET